MMKMEANKTNKSFEFADPATTMKTKDNALTTL